MLYCAECCEGCCKGIGDCCDSVCSGCLSACEGCTKWCGKLFSRPFSMCVFLGLFLLLLPGFAGIYGFTLTEEPLCDPDPSLQCLVSGINLLLIFAFVCYLCYTLGASY